LADASAGAPGFHRTRILLLLAISVTTFFVDGLQVGSGVFCFLSCYLLLYLRNRRRKESVQ